MPEFWLPTVHTLWSPADKFAWTFIKNSRRQHLAKFWQRISPATPIGKALIAYQLQCEAHQVGSITCCHQNWNPGEKKTEKKGENPKHLTCNDSPSETLSRRAVEPQSLWQATNGQNLSSNLNGILLSSPKTSTRLVPPASRVLGHLFQFFFSYYFGLHMQPENCEWAWSQSFESRDSRGRGV